jgi:hypothetical protein
MRHEQLLLTEGESRLVIEEVNSWIRRTGTNWNKLVTAARVNPSTRGWVRSGRSRLSITTAAKLKEAMRANPHGIAKGEHKTRLANYRARFVPPPPPPAPVDRTPCIRCGANPANGCEHMILSSATMHGNY